MRCVIGIVLDKALGFPAAGLLSTSVVLQGMDWRTAEAFGVFRVTTAVMALTGMAPRMYSIACLSSQARHEKGKHSVLALAACLD